MRWFRQDFWVGQRVRNKSKGWYGHVHAVECNVCGADVNNGFACGHVKNGYCLTIAQGDFLKPWCRPQDYEDATERRTVWERLGLTAFLFVGIMPPML